MTPPACQGCDSARIARTLVKVAKLMDRLGPAGQRLLAEQIGALYAPPLPPRQLAARRAARYRERHAERDEPVTPSVTPTVTLSVTKNHAERDAGVTPSVTKNHAERDETTLYFPSSSPSSSPVVSGTVTTAVNGGNYRKVRKEQEISANNLIEFLNEKAGKSFRKNARNRMLILARFADGFSEQNLRGIVARKVREWGGTEMAKYLRPETLFNAQKAESYLGERTPEAEPCSVPSAPIS